MTQENKDIQSKNEPYVVKSHDIHIDADYADWIADIKSRYRSAQVKAAVKVNAEKLLFNWQLGRDLVHQGKIINNFTDHLPTLQSKLVQEVLKENYDFGFATVEHEFMTRLNWRRPLAKGVAGDQTFDKQK